MNNLVVYKNDMNTVPLRDFNSKEMDLFFSICSQMRDKDLDKITFTFEQLKDLSNYKYEAFDRFITDIENVYNKLIKLNIRIETEEKIVRFVLFTDYEVDKIKSTVNISVHKEFKYILNDITGNFTKFELAEFVSLKSSYSKTAYRLLKQFRKTGYMVLTIDDFKEQFSIPRSYRMSHIDIKVLQPIQNELSLYFKNLEINKISKGKGRKITHIEFVFDAEADINSTGTGTFRDENGFYYNKQLLDFTAEEMDKKCKPTVEPMADRYDKKRLEEKEKMKQKWLELFPEDIDMFKN